MNKDNKYHDGRLNRRCPPYLRSSMDHLPRI